VIRQFYTYTFFGYVCSWIVDLRKEERINDVSSIAPRVNNPPETLATLPPVIRFRVQLTFRERLLHSFLTDGPVFALMTSGLLLALGVDLPLVILVLSMALWGTLFGFLRWIGGVRAYSLEVTPQGIRIERQPRGDAEEIAWRSLQKVEEGVFRDLHQGSLLHTNHKRIFVPYPREKASQERVRVLMRAAIGQWGGFKI